MYKFINGCGQILHFKVRKFSPSPSVCVCVCVCVCLLRYLKNPYIVDETINYTLSAIAVINSVLDHCIATKLLIQLLASPLTRVYYCICNLNVNIKPEGT